MSKPWFALTKQRIGWIPITWQGWLLTIAFICFTIYNFIRIDSLSHSVSDTMMQFVPQTILFTGFFSVVCYLTADKSSSRKMR